MKKIIAWLLVLALTAAISIGATLAYLTDTDEDVNVMTLGNVKIDQLEYERIDDETKNEDAAVQEFHDNKPLYPGVYENGFDFGTGDANVDWTQIGKDGYTSGIWNPEKINNELDKMVFVKNKGTYDAYTRTVFAFEAGNYETLDEFKSMVHLNLNETDWTWEWIEAPVEIPNEEGGTTKYFVATATYNNVLEPGKLTEISLSQIALDKTATNADVEAFGETYQILVKTQAIQAAGFESPAVALDDGFGLITASSIPWESDKATKGGTLTTALHYLNADPTETSIIASVTDIVFGKNAEYPEIVNNYEGYLVDVEQDIPAYAYYVDNSQVTRAATGYTVYVLSDDVIYAPKDSSYLFAQMKNLESVNAEKLNTSRTVNMTEMFQDCVKLKSVDASTWDTSSVTVLDRMFNQCSALQTVNTTGWDLRNVTSAERTFRKCVALTSVPGHEDWVLSSAKSVYGLFVTCEKLTTLDASKWDFGSLVNARDLFYGCISLKEVKGLGNWNTGNVESLWDTFGVCKSLETLEGLQNWDVSKVTKFAGTFQQCVKLTDEDVAVMYDWNLDSVTDISWLFKGATGLVNIDLSKWDVSKVTAFNSLFSCIGSNNGSMNLISAGIENWDTSSATHMGWMFMGCGKMTSIDLSNWNTDNLIHAGHMFADCFKLETVNFDGWTAPKLQTIDAMFNDCRAMKEVDMSDFTMDSCFEFSQTFEACYSLERVIGMENWDTSKGCTFVEMFNGCKSLKELNWSSFDTHAAYDRYYDLNNSYSNAFNPIFGSVNSLEKLIVSDKISYYGNGNVSEGNKLVFPNPVAKEGYSAKWQNVETGELYLGKEIPEGVAATYVPYYEYISKGESLYNALNYLDANPKGTKISTKVNSVTFGLEQDYADITTNYTGVLTDGEQALPVYTYYVPNGSNYDLYVLSDDTIYAPADCSNLCNGMSNLVSFNTANLDFSKTTSMYRMLRDCGKLSQIDVSTWNTANVTNMHDLFRGCKSVPALDVSNWETGKVTTMLAMFQDCALITELDLNNWDVSNLTTVQQMFNRCYALEVLHIENWNPKNLVTGTTMFQHCTALKELDLSGWDTSSLTNTNGMFNHCESITCLDVSTWDMSHVTDASLMFQYCASLQTLDLSKWNTESFVNVNSMFYNCASLKELNVGSWDVSKVNNFLQMFVYCYALEKLEGLGNWDTSNGAKFGNFLNSCNSLKELDLTNFNTAKATDLSGFFTGLDSLQKLTVGENFSCNANGKLGSGKTTAFPAPANVEGSDGKWYNIETGEAYARSEIPQTTATYVAVNPNP